MSADWCTVDDVEQSFADENGENGENEGRNRETGTSPVPRVPDKQT